MAHGETRGLNAARNTAIEAAQADLLCFLDDDAEAWPGWLGALLAAAQEHPEHEAFGGPIQARLEGTNLHACGREPPPVTTLDLGPDDRDAEFVWGANLTLRRSALERVGGFDPGLDLYGDEEDWQRRLHAAGGRIRYVAAAGVDHRRTGKDARIGGLSRAAYGRGRNSRRYDARKGVAPPVAAELRTLAGCLWHIVRRRCGNGIVLTALTLGRLREALRPKRVPPSTRDPDYLSGRSGTLGRRGLLAGRLRDARANVRTAPHPPAAGEGRAHEPEPQRARALGRAAAATSGRRPRSGTSSATSHHDALLRIVAPAEGAGKWANLNAALVAHPPRGFHWLLIVDDDVVLPARLPRRLHLARRAPRLPPRPAGARLRLARRLGGDAAPTRPDRPAHALRGDRAGDRDPGRRVRRPAAVPRPPDGLGARRALGGDGRAAALEARVIDATPIRHTRPVAAAYPRDAAMAEADRFLAGKPYVTREQAAEVLEEFRD